MKKSIFSAMFALVAVIMMSFTGGDAVYKLNTEASNAHWKGYKVTGAHDGDVKFKTGELKFDAAGNLSGGSFEVDMNSMKCSDLTGEYADKLLGHLKADDFFGTAKYPTAKFVITKVVYQGKGQARVIGNMTIKDVTKEIRFVAYTGEKDGMMTADCFIKIDRTDFGVTYGSGSITAGLLDKTIYDEFDLDIKLKASK
jgi:polyisoprenoid-binding protein YceI